MKKLAFGPLLCALALLASCSGGQVRGPAAAPAIPDNSAAGPCVVPAAGPDGWVPLAPSCAASVSRGSPRPLLLYFFTEWCGPCKDLDRKTFPDPKVQDFLRQRLLAVKVDSAPGPGKDLADSLGVHSYPTLVLLDRDGAEIERAFGFLAPQDFVQTFGDYLEGRNTSADLLRQAQAAPEDLALQFRAGKELAVRGKVEAAEPLLRRVLDSQTTLVDRPTAAYILAKTVYVDGLQKPDLALPILDDLIANQMQAWQGREAFFVKAGILVQAGRKAEATQLLQTVRDYPRKDPLVFQRLAGFCLQYRVATDFALEQAGVLLELHPDQDWLWKTRAELRFHGGDLAGAKADLEQALKLSPGNQPYKALLEVVKRRLEVK